MDTWQAVIIAVSAGLAVIVTAFFTGLKEIITSWMEKLNRKIKKQTYIQRVEKLARFLELFEGLQDIKEVDRCLIFHGHNCGGLPRPGKPYTVRALHGWCTSPNKEDPLHRYNFELQVDVHYIRILEDIVKIGKSFQQFDLMPADSKLRSYYEAEGVVSAVIYYLGIVDEELIFISAASYTAKAYSHTTEVKLQLEVDKMRALIGEDS